MVEMTDLLKIKPQQWHAVLLSFVAILGPGVLVVFVFLPQLFMALDLGKLVLLAVALAVPAVFLSTLIALPYALIRTRGAAAREDGVDLYVASCAITAIHLYLSLGLAYLLSLGFREFGAVVAGTYLAHGAFAWVRAWRGRS